MKIKKLLTLFALNAFFIGGSLNVVGATDLPKPLSKLRPSQYSDMAVGNVIGDEKPDIVYDSYHQIRNMTHRIVILENLGNNKFKKHEAKLELPLSRSDYYAYQLSIKDMDGDGLNDIIAKGEGYLAVFKNKGNLDFEEINIE